MLASDLNNTEFQGAMNPDSRLNVKFYSKPVQNNFLTEKEGRPIFDDRDFIIITTPGDTLNIVDTYADDEHKRRFPLHWAHYQNNKDKTVEHGTPLSAWGLLTPAQCEEFRFLKFLTVENLASASDQQLQSIGMRGGMSAFSIRDKAKAFLSSTKLTADSTNRQQELDALKEQTEKQAAELAEMKELLLQAQKPKMGRPAKEK